MKKPDPFCEAVLGDFKPDKVASNKDTLAFVRKGECNVPETYAMDWIDPTTFEKMKIWGKVNLVEYKLVSKKNGDIGFNRQIEPCIKGGQMKKAL